MHLELRTEAWDIDMDTISLGVDDIESCGNGWYFRVCRSRWSWPHVHLLKAFCISDQTPQVCRILHGSILAYLSRLLIDHFLRTILLFTGLQNVLCSIFSLSLFFPFSHSQNSLLPSLHHCLTMYTLGFHADYAPGECAIISLDSVGIPSLCFRSRL